MSTGVLTCTMPLIIMDRREVAGSSEVRVQYEYLVVYDDEANTEGEGY